MSSGSRVAGIVVNYRTPALTERAVRSLLDDGAAEAVVVDNSVDDPGSAGLRTLEDDARVRYLPAAENVGFGQGVNKGAAAATGDLLFVLNSDAEVSPGATAALIAALADPTVAIAAPFVRGRDGVLQADAHGVFPTIRSLLLRTNRHPPPTLEPDWVSGVAFLVSAEVFRSIGGFDGRFFMYFEDVDLCRRVREPGHRIVRVPTATVLHQHGGSRESPQSAQRQYLASQDEYMRAAEWSPWRIALVRSGRVPLIAARRLLSK